MADNLFMAPKRHRILGMTVMELLCVIAIISILAAIYLVVIARAFVHVKKFLGK
jgi:prepilin-type N-terminal cleavage/methylation domain-containing protein